MIALCGVWDDGPAMDEVPLTDPRICRDCLDVALRAKRLHDCAATTQCGRRHA